MTLRFWSLAPNKVSWSTPPSEIERVEADVSVGFIRPEEFREADAEPSTRRGGRE
jgi:hypothetical protein